MNKNILLKLNVACLLFVGGTCYAQQSSQADKIVIGYGVEQQASKSTVSADVISGEELRKSSAINLKDALYGKLLGLSAYKSGGFEGDSGFGANFNIRGIKSPSENNVLILVDGFERPIDRISVE